MSVQGISHLVKQFEWPAHNNVDEACVGVVRDCIEECILVYLWRGGERGARLVYRHDDLSAMARSRPRRQDKEPPIDR